MCLGSWDAETLLHGLDTVEKDCFEEYLGWSTDDGG
jgi:hypothetical protein